MSQAQNHIIQRLTVELTHPNQAEAYQHQSAIREQVYAKLLPKVERLFDQLVSPDEIIHLDRLELASTQSTTEYLDDELIENLLEQIKEQIQRHQQKHQEEEKPFSSTFSRWQTAFIHFIQHGFLPWYANSKWPAVQQAIESIEDKQFASFIHSLAPLLQESNSRKRMIQQLSASTWNRMINTFVKNPKTQRETILILKKIARKETTLTPSGEAIQTSILQVIVRSKPVNYLNPLIELVKRLEQQIYTIQSSITIGETDQQKILIDQQHQKLRQQLDQISSNPSVTIEQNQQVVDDSLSVVENPETKNEAQASASNREEIVSNQVAKPTTNNSGTAIYIQNAGLVLCASYLKLFFDRQGLLKEGQFKDEFSQQKAMLLLACLVNRSTSVQETRYPLNKLLCGWPLEQTLDAQLQLEDTEVEACEQLLQAMITHWTQLGNSSVAALQEGFLQREGKLIQEKEGWLLIVEKKGIDILLESAPWNFKLIKLPWMPQLLNVEWI